MTEDNTEQSVPYLALVGATATGKTAVGVLLAEALGGEIVSADSMAVYRHMNIGTAKPTPQERERAAFHLIDVAEPDAPYSVAEFKRQANAALQAIARRGKPALLVGGTGLYVRALLDDFGLTETPADPEIRARLDAEAARLGAPALHARLAEVDALAATRIHPNDRIRIVRALEVWERTGEPISVQQARDRERRSRQPSRVVPKFGLTASRERLNERIEARVDAMIAAGLEAEVRGLLSRGYGAALPPLRSLGYKEMVAYVRGEADLPTTIDAIKQNTRRFAKRQGTWFRADPAIAWLDVGESRPADVAAAILARLPR